jgi:hypothetical protein
VARIQALEKLSQTAQTKNAGLARVYKISEIDFKNPEPIMRPMNLCHAVARIQQFKKTGTQGRGGAYVRSF